MLVENVRYHNIFNKTDIRTALFNSFSGVKLYFCSLSFAVVSIFLTSTSIYDKFS